MPVYFTEIGDGDDVVAQLSVDDAVFWIAAAGDSSERLVPKTLGGATARLLLRVSDPEAAQARALAAGPSRRPWWDWSTAG